MENDWKLTINTISYSLEAEVFIYRKIGNMVHYMSFDEKGYIKITSITYQEGSIGHDIKPAFIGNKDLVDEIAKVFIAYANNQGFKNGDETFVKGKLEATEKHLEDMRTLVFKKK